MFKTWNNGRSVRSNVRFQLEIIMYMGITQQITQLRSLLSYQSILFHKESNGFKFQTKEKKIEMTMLLAKISYIDICFHILVNVRQWMIISDGLLFTNQYDLRIIR